MPTKEDVTKLPKWAQELIENYEMRLKETEQQVEQLLTRPNEKSRIVVDPYSASAIRHLDHESLIRFYLPTKLKQQMPHQIDIRFTGRADFKQGLLIRGNNSTLQITPAASNMIYLCVNED